MTRKVVIAVFTDNDTGETHHRTMAIPNGWDEAHVERFLADSIAILRNGTLVAVTSYDDIEGDNDRGDRLFPRPPADALDSWWDEVRQGRIRQVRQRSTGLVGTAVRAWYMDGEQVVRVEFGEFGEFEIMDNIDNFEPLP